MPEGAGDCAQGDAKDHARHGEKGRPPAPVPLPGEAPLRKALQKYESVYDHLMEALEIAVNEDLERLADDPVWLAPEVKDTIPQRPGGAPSHNLYVAGGQSR